MAGRLRYGSPLRLLVALALAFAVLACGTEDEAARSDEATSSDEPVRSDDAAGSDDVCTDDLVRAAAELSPPPGMRVTFKPSITEEDCVAIASTDLSGEEVLDHYRAEFAAHGWTDNGAGQMGGISAIKDGVALDIAPGEGPDAARVSFLVYPAAAIPPASSAEEAPYAILFAYWPEDLDGAIKVLERLRDRLSSQDVSVETSDNEASAVLANDTRVRVTGDRDSDPAAGLTAMTSDFTCDPASLAGTAPDISAGKAAGQPQAEVWFTCDIKPGSAQTAARYAVGWAWEDTAWLVVTDTPQNAEDVIETMIEEAAEVHWAD